MTWSKNCVLTAMETKDAVTDAQVNVTEKATNALTGATYTITGAKLYVPIVILSAKNDKLLHQLKTRFKRTIKWNRYRSEMTNQAKTNNLNYLIDPTFSKVNILFVLSFGNEDDRTSFSKYYASTVEIKYCIVGIDGQSFSDVPIKHKKETEKNY